MRSPPSRCEIATDRRSRTRCGVRWRCSRPWLATEMVDVSSDTTNTVASVSSDNPSAARWRDRKSTRLNSSHVRISYAVFGLKKKNSHHRLLPQRQQKQKNIYNTRI